MKGADTGNIEIIFFLREPNPSYLTTYTNSPIDLNGTTHIMT